MLKKILKSIFKEKLSHRQGSSNDAWKRMKQNRYSHLGHQHYKRRKKSGSIFSSFFSS